MSREEFLTQRLAERSNELHVMRLKNEELREENARLRAAAGGEQGGEAERLRKAIEDYLSGDYDHPRIHRPGKCKHGRNYWEECSECDGAHFQAALTGGEGGGEQDQPKENYDDPSVASWTL